MSIQRYTNRSTPDGVWLDKADDGDWMLYADHEAELAALRARVARLVGAISCAKDLTTIVRMPNVEHVADAHNAAVAKLRAALEEQ